jgi:hypothetical protein
LQAYPRGSSLQGALVAAKLEKTAGDIPAESLDEFGAGVVLADLMDSPGRKKRIGRLWSVSFRWIPSGPSHTGDSVISPGAPDVPNRPLSSSARRSSAAIAIQHSCGTTAVCSGAAKAKQPSVCFPELLQQDIARMDVRLELAEAQLRQNHAVAALATINPVRTGKPADSARFFRIAVYAYLHNGDRKNAAETAKHFLDIAKTQEDRDEAGRLVSLAAAGDRPPDTRLVELPDAERPSLKRHDNEAPAAEPARQERPTAMGCFVELDCRTSRRA